MCGNAADAEDMVQDVFVQALRKWHTFKGMSDPGTWLYAIAARACRSRSRRKGGIDRRMPAMSQLMPWSETSVAQFAASSQNLSSDPERREAVARVQYEITRLPEHVRLPLVLKEVLELSVSETAAALGLAENTVKTRLRRARLALRKAMMARATLVDAPAPLFEKQVCMDLLKAKLDSMDETGSSTHFSVPQAEVCARCAAVFKELDLVQDACAHMGDGRMPPALRATILRAINEHARTTTRTQTALGPGRRPVQARRG